MKTKLVVNLVFVMLMLVACRSGPALPELTVPVGTEFMLAAGQSATITGTGLVIAFRSVPGDDRCPSEVECATSGPVTVSIQVRQGNAEAADLTLQTFTDADGRAPEGPFEGIEDRVELDDYRIRLTSVIPYPKNSSSPIEPSEYQATFIVTQR